MYQESITSDEQSDELPDSIIVATGTFQSLTLNQEAHKLVKRELNSKLK
jgi:hypothetical protein